MSDDSRPDAQAEPLGSGAGAGGVVSPSGDVVPLGTLVPDPHNRRAHPARNVEMITTSLREVGPGRSIVIDERDEIIAGNGVVQAAPGAGVTKVRIVEAAADELIAVRRRDLTPEQKRAMAIYDNRTGELAEWNSEQLTLDDAAGLPLAPYWTDAELVELEVHDPRFGPVDAETQGRLDALKLKREVMCPHCGHVFEV